MLWKYAAWFLAAGALSVFGRDIARVAPLPSDPLELAAGPTRIANAPAKRATALRSLNQARSNYVLQNRGQGYDLKVTFKIDSGGQTAYDGVWHMEDVFDPHLGLRWTAQGPGSYTITRINSNGMFFGDQTGNYVPLRLQEARAALLDPLPGARNLARSTIRTANAIFNGVEVTCMLFSSSRVSATPGRRWDETEECVDPKSGLLQVHSQVPGRYYAYDYTDGPTFAGHVFPRKVTVTEAGRTITEISVDSLTALPAADPSLFAPTEEMKAKGRAISLVGAQKVFHDLRGAPASAVCVFGVVTPAGELVEAHSLQPANSNSAAALADAKQMNFSNQTGLGAPPEQRFVFIIEEFVP